MVSSVQQLNTPRSVPPGRVLAMAWSSESLPESIISFRIFKFSSTEFFFFTPSFGWAEPSPEMTILCSMSSPLARVSSTRARVAKLCVVCLADPCWNSQRRQLSRL